MAPTHMSPVQDNPFRTHIARDGLSSSNNHTMMDLVIVLIVLLVTALGLAGGLLFLRRRRRARKALELPMYADEKRMSAASLASSTSNHHRRVMARASEAAVSVYDEKKELAKELDSPPDSPLPEIRITFPEEIDDATGKMTSGRVVVVHVGEMGVGLEPADHPPAYQLTESGERFHSLDLDRIGGLVEKARNSPKAFE